ncbi:MAG: V4R domain-containing protein [candidate division WOR-3 bacterium]
MKKPFGPFDYTEYDPETGVIKAFGVPSTFHCNVFNYFFRLGVVNLLGERGRDLVYESSEIAHYRLFKSTGLKGQELLDFGKEYFKSRGLGVLSFKSKNEIILYNSTHGHTSIIIEKRHSEKPSCDVERGFLSGLLHAALDVPLGTLQVEEYECMAMGNPACKMEVKVINKPKRFEEPNYTDEIFIRLDGKIQKEKIEKIKQIMPVPDESGVLAIPSRFADIRKVWVTLLPTEYYSRVNLKMFELLDEEKARYYTTLAGFNCVSFTYISLYHTPFGEIVCGNLGEKDEMEALRCFIELSDYLGFGRVKTSFEKVKITLDIYNFYDNNYALALKSKPRSYFAAGAMLASKFAILDLKAYKEDFKMSALGIFNKFDNIYYNADWKTEFDENKSHQRVIINV